jgi:hypothetical protein
VFPNNLNSHLRAAASSTLRISLYGSSQPGDLRGKTFFGQSFAGSHGKVTEYTKQVDSSGEALLNQRIG